MMIAPDFRLLFLPLVVTVPLAFAFYMFGFWAGSKLVGAPRNNWRNALAVLLQWFIVIPLQLILGYQLNLWIPEAAAVAWFAVLLGAIPLAGMIAAYLVCRHQPKQCFIVGLVASVIGFVTSTVVFWITFNLNS